MARLLKKPLIIALAAVILLVIGFFAYIQNAFTGTRCEAAKHLDADMIGDCYGKTEASAALREWKKANPDKALDDKPFWMTGEAWGHGSCCVLCRKRSNAPSPPNCGSTWR